jgi:hypothetical protein
MSALADTAHGVYEIDVDTEDVLGLDADASLEPRVRDSAGDLVVEIVEGRRPPLRVSRDGGLTWEEAGGGLPAGRSVAVHPEEPGLVLFAGRNRLFVSRDGGRFWRALVLELPEIRAVVWTD